MANLSRRVETAAVCAAAALALGACGSARRGEPLRGPLLTTEAAQDRGRIVFAQNCYKCHPGGEAGLGPALNNRPWPARLKKFEIRHNMGAMPSFDKSRLSDSDLHDLMAYLAILRTHSERDQEPFEAREASR